ncbi:MAG TPA: alkaline phosphatase family protein [Candidatus Acidoferrales bacterium]|nr:alkaline phosphatase family protein [Candidatus Acidoferrales bacterium]
MTYRQTQRLLGPSLLILFVWLTGTSLRAQEKHSAAVAAHAVTRSVRSNGLKLVVVLVVDQMRADYIDKFQQHWTGGLKRLATQGAWLRNAAYPYAETETCVGHSTISTGSLPATHGIISNSWWDRASGKSVTCTDDPGVKNVGYGGAVEGGDSAVRLLIPSFAEELKFQRGGRPRVFTFSLKARAALMLAGHSADGVTWFDSRSGYWATSTAYPTVPFVKQYVEKHPANEDFGKAWNLLLPASSYLYGPRALGSVPPSGWNQTFPHVLRGEAQSKGPDSAYYNQWETSPFPDTYLVKLAEDAVTSEHLGHGADIDYLGVSFSSPDHVAHAFGPRSREIQDELSRLDLDLGGLFSFLDRNVGSQNYVVVLTADHGGTPVPDDMKTTGVNAGWVSLAAVKQNIEAALVPFHYPTPSVAMVDDADVFFEPGVYQKLLADPSAMHAVIQAIEKVPGVKTVYRADQLKGRPATENPIRRAESDSFFPTRSGDLLIVPQPYWSWDFTRPGRKRGVGAMHGSPYYYDQHVPILFMGYGIQPGIYYAPATPEDIAPTLAELCGITLASRDGSVLGEILRKSR